MNKSNKKKSNQLGMPFGTACGQLRKKILFHLLQKLNEDVCYRCSKKIKELKNLSIEHKLSWLDVSPNLFWDLNNIAFSHLSCNVKYQRRPNKVEYPKGEKWCWRCKTIKDLSKFPEYAKLKRNRECTTCYSKYRAEYRKRPNKK